MTTANFTTRSSVPALVTAAIAAWFVFASGSALAEATRPSAASARNQITLTPEGSMKLTVVAARPASPLAMTPTGSMKLTVVAQRALPARVQSVAVRDASRG